MKKFTDSPFESLMQEKPYCNHKDRYQPPSECKGCGSFDGGKCPECTRITNNNREGDFGSACPEVRMNENE